MLLRTPHASRLSAGLRQESAAVSQNDSLLENHADQQALLIRRQDEDLDDLAVHVARLGTVGRTIGQELDEQGKMLEELEEDVDGTTTRLGAAQRKLTRGSAIDSTHIFVLIFAAEVIKKSGMSGQLAIIGCLISALAASH